jgi:DUF1680 family protein
MPSMPSTDTVQPFVVDTLCSPHVRLRPVSLADVALQDAFWQPRRNINREVTLASQYHHLEESGCLDNFRRAAGQKECDFRGPVFMDSDAYKWLEAAASTLATHSESALEAMVESVIDLLAAAQQPDGYLNTRFMFDKASQRWTNLHDWHEMYCAGHLIQAAVAHYRATGSSCLLDIARRVADNLCETFGPAEESKQPGTDGHPEVEMALVELFRATGEHHYLAQAQYLVDARGCKPSVVYRTGPENLPSHGDRYCQDHVAFRELDEVTGHAVRMIYLTSGATDLFHETGDTALKAALDLQWDNMTTRRMYVSGGLGSRYEGEAFGKDYESPNERAYTETCAAIASVMWNHRMLAINGDARYADLLEWTLFNAVMPGLSLDGHHYYYQNPLADDGTHRREAWFGCACCPPNVARLLAQLPGYMYSVSDEGVWAHLYAQGTARLSLPDGQQVELAIETQYPWDSDIRCRIKSSGTWSLNLRVPGWCEEGAWTEINGQRQEGAPVPGSYLNLRREWQVGDEVRLHLPIPVRRLQCHPYVAENQGHVALARGPLLYCLEAVDNPSADLRDVALPRDSQLTASYRDDVLGGVFTLDGQGTVEVPDVGWDGHLYRTARSNRTPLISGESSRTEAVPLTFVPYYAWANREPGRMQVWVREG